MLNDYSAIKLDKQGESSDSSQCGFGLVTIVPECFIHEIEMCGMEFRL